MAEKQLGYFMRRQIKGVKKMQAEGEETSPFLRVTLDNGHRLKVPLDGTIEKEVLGRIRKGVIIEGQFDGIHGWTPEGQRFAQVNTVMNADLKSIEKGSYEKPVVDESIETVDWDTVEATIQKTYVAPGSETAAPGAAPDMSALADALKQAPQT